MNETMTARQPGRWRLRWAVARQEIANIARHPYYMVSFAIPVFMSLAFLLFVSSVREADDLIVVVYDAGRSDWAATLARWSEAQIEMVDSETALLHALSDEATGGIIIPVGFDTAVARGESPELAVYINQNAYAAHIADFKRLLNEEVWAINEAPPPAHITWYETGGSGRDLPLPSVENYIVVIFVVLGICMTTMGILAQAIVEKRETGALPALLASPLTFGDVLWGQSTAVFLYTVLLTGILLVINGGVTGNVGLTAVSCILTTFVLLGLGLLFGLSSPSKNQCNAYTGVVGIVLIIPSWFALIPVEDIALPVTAVLHLLPTTYLIDILGQTLSGTATWATVWLDLLALCLFAAVFLGAVRWRLQRQPVW
jgi:ABC-2 type transport system permease protein